MFSFASVASGILFLYARVIFCEFYLHDSKEPCTTCVLKLSRKLRNLQYVTFCDGRMDREWIAHGAIFVVLVTRSFDINFFSHQFYRTEEEKKDNKHLHLTLFRRSDGLPR